MNALRSSWVNSLLALVRGHRLVGKWGDVSYYEALKPDGIARLRRWSDTDDNSRHAPELFIWLRDPQRMPPSAKQILTSQAERDAARDRGRLREDNEKDRKVLSSRKANTTPELETGDEEWRPS